jgi:hypothetical protein
MKLLSLFAILLLHVINSNAQSFDSLVEKTAAVPIYIIDGVQVSKMKALKYEPSNILSVSVYKPPLATRYFGEKGKNGAVIIRSKIVKRKRLQPELSFDSLQKS